CWTYGPAGEQGSRPGTVGTHLRARFWRSKQRFGLSDGCDGRTFLCGHYEHQRGIPDLENRWSRQSSLLLEESDRVRGWAGSLESNCHVAVHVRWRTVRGYRDPELWF